MARRHIFLIFALFMICRGSSLATGKPQNVLVVQNSNSPMSMRIAAYYVTARSIPADNLVSVNTIDSSLSSSNEIMTYTNYLSSIETPIRTYLTSHNLTNVIQYIVLTKGIPHRLSAEVTGGNSEGQSVDSMLATIDLINPLRVGFENENHVLIGSPYINRYWRSEQPFSHAVYGGYLVTRLDGYTEANAKALVDRATVACNTPSRVLLDARSAPSPTLVALQPKSILLPDGSDIDPNYQLMYEDYDADLVRASQVISNRPFLNTVIDQTTAFIGSANPLSCYVSWGSNSTNYNPITFHSLTFAARAIAETAVSTSGQTLLPTSTGLSSWGQSLIADLISQGAAGAKGYVTEPYLDAIASPTVLVDMYTSGRNLAESFYTASRFLGWKDIVLGDPLCALDLTNGSISAAKDKANQSLVTIKDGVVTAGTDDFASFLYVQDAKCPSGIRVQLPPNHPSVIRGATVTIRGILSTTSDSERVITNARIVF